MFLNNVNTKRLGMLIGAIFIWVFASDFVVHGMLLKDTYQATAHLWRTESEMQSMFGYMLFGQFLVAAFFSLIFVKGYESKGLAEGLRFGILAAGFLTGPLFIEYAVSPLPMSLLLSWTVANLFQSIGAGAVASVVYRK
jgi:hypothetical protein